MKALRSIRLVVNGYAAPFLHQQSIQMIPLIISILTALLVYLSDKLDDMSRGMTASIVFTMMLFLSNYIIFRLLKDESIEARISIENPTPYIYMDYYVFDSTRVYGKNIIRIPNHCGESPYLRIQVERKILPKRKRLYLTLPIFWFDPVNQWKCVRTADIKLYSRQINHAKKKKNRSIFARSKDISKNKNIKYIRV